ncbi:hypothetical protein H4N54_02315 [Limnospira fusiformis KN01]|uniref:Uncharacterized protein n=1 Tax=Limnospira fusiformis PMC 851.14 TaxID=2219512 RepID=A0ABU9ERV0_LIMFS|nr:MULTISPECIES: hypothetical protein [Limnospira]MDY7050980.1 hypothetical protein [Limnospira fusiformis LS22]QJB24943.1 hypothetical protein HFV01_02885 [Limnospira fusiformis SAG 85.79]MDT9201112.1 hypothetical protein [Limnospira sp. PMC 1042.18]MDT9277631.1 hypothetical protein [Limnospira sp. PMC 737.11]ULB46253.1 hypothetical protein H4N54_02315 [Limnospira fusiformis KN01]
MLHYRNLLEIAEYVGLAVTVVGTVATFTGRSLLYGGIPLLIFLAIGLVNRYLLKQYLRSLTFNVKANVDLNTQAIEQLNHIAQANAVSANINTLKSTANLDMAALTDNLTTLNGTLQNILERQNALEQAIDAIQGELELVVRKFQQRPELEQVENLTHVIVDLQQFINQLPQWGALQQQQLNELQERVSGAIADLPRQVEVAISDRLDNST